MKRPTIETTYSQRRWGRGRIWQLTQRLCCRLRGHEFNHWNFDWPWDCPDVPESQRDPGVDEVLLWIRGCGRGCGAIQMSRVSLRYAGLLPGDRTGLYGNPIRRFHT